MKHAETADQVPAPYRISRELANRQYRLKQDKDIKQSLRKDPKGIYSSLNDLLDERLREDLQFSEDEVTTTAAAGGSYLKSAKLADTSLPGNPDALNEVKRPNTGLIRVAYYRATPEQPDELLSPWTRLHPTASAANKGVGDSPAVVRAGRQTPTTSGAERPTSSAVLAESGSSTPLPRPQQSRQLVSRKVLRDALKTQMITKDRVKELDHHQKLINSASRREDSVDLVKVWVQDLHGTYKTSSSQPKTNVFAASVFPPSDRARWLMLKDQYTNQNVQHLRKRGEHSKDHNVASFIRSFFDASNKRINDETMRNSSPKAHPFDKEHSQDGKVPRKFMGMPRPSAAISLLSRRIWMEKKQSSESLVNNSKLFSDNHMRSRAPRKLNLESRIITRKQSDSKSTASSKQAALLLPMTPVIQTKRKFQVTARAASLPTQGVRVIGLKPQSRYLSSSQRQH